jgi:tetratricopeptide (TPR) repeat protein
MTWSYGQKELKRAEVQSQSGAYEKAIKNYELHLKDNPTDYNAVFQLAEAYKASGNLYQAHLWYQSIPEEAAVSAEVYKNHGDLLKNMFRYDDALIKYQTYSEFHPEKGQRLIDGIEYARSEMAAQPRYDTENLPFNTSVSDFAMNFYRGITVYSSFREDMLMSEQEREMNPDLNKHKTIAIHPVRKKSYFIKNHKGEINGAGPVSFSEDGSKCAFIQAEIKDNNNIIRGIKSSTLYLAEVDASGIITSSVPFEHNDIGSSIISAHLAYGGSVLYFASDRQGGLGGYDIYVSYLNDGRWSLPENLGNTINTSGNEVTPYFEDGKLFFASDEHTGLGGYDIFTSRVLNGMWSTPQNLGHVINTPADEYFPVVNIHGDLFYTSNKLGGKGSNDIYRAIEIEESLPMLVTETSTEELEVPEAVSLEALATEVEKHSSETNGTDDIQNVSFRLPEFDVHKVGMTESEDVDLSSAHRVALDEIMQNNTEVFFIQLASVSASKPNYQSFKSLLKYGNIYKTHLNNAVKVRLGYYNERKEAEDVLRKVREKGYKDAFIAKELLNTAQIELVLASKDSESFSDDGHFNTRNEDVRKEYYESNKYKVRLASYEDPIWFDVNKVKDLGRVEQWTKGNWTIFILAGFNSLDEAKQAQIQAQNRGYRTAEVVIDNGGILERLKKN